MFSFEAPPVHLLAQLRASEPPVQSMVDGTPCVFKGLSSGFSCHWMTIWQWVYSIQSNSWRNPHVKSSKSFNQEFKGYHSETPTTDCFNITLSEFYSDHDSAPHISSSHPCPAFLLQGCCRSNRVKPVATIYTELQVGQRKSVTRVSRPKRPSQ